MIPVGNDDIDAYTRAQRHVCTKWVFPFKKECMCGQHKNVVRMPTRYERSMIQEVLESGSVSGIDYNCPKKGDFIMEIPFDWTGTKAVVHELGELKPELFVSYFPKRDPAERSVVILRGPKEIIIDLAKQMDAIAMDILAFRAKIWARAGL